MKNFVPGTVRGIWLKSKLPKRQAYVDSLSCWREERRKLSVVSHFSVRWYHPERGKYGSVEESPDMKWFFKVWMTHSAEFCWWM